MTAFTFNFITLLTKRQAIDFNNIVQHAGKNLDDLAILFPVELCIAHKGPFNKTCQVDRT